MYGGEGESICGEFLFGGEAESTCNGGSGGRYAGIIFPTWRHGVNENENGDPNSSEGDDSALKTRVVISAAIAIGITRGRGETISPRR